ncbi:MAG: hypothetical protein ACAH81_11805 [Actinomycetota bacterium]
MRCRPSLRVVVLAALLVGGASGAAWAQSPSGASPSAASPAPTPRPGAETAVTEDQVMLSGTLAVPRGRTVGQVVVFHGRALVAGVAAGDVVVLDGPVVISGQVSGTVVAMNGPIRLAATAFVAGDVLGGQSVRVDPGARVGGNVRDDVSFTPRGPLAALGALLGAIAVAVSTLGMMLLFLAVAPRGLDRVATAARTAPFASFGWGLLLALGLPLVALGTTASILALPFGLALLLGFALIALMGFSLAAWAAGRLLVKEPRGRAAALFAGWGIAAAVGLVPFLNVAVWLLGSVFGLGAATVAVWRARSARSARGRHRAGTVVRPSAPAPRPGQVPDAAADRGPSDLEPAGATETYPATSDD